MNNSQKGSANTVLVILVIIFALIAVYFAFIKKPAVVTVPVTSQTSPVTTTTGTQPVPTTQPIIHSNTTLPTYVQNANAVSTWPPVIVQSAAPYSCTPIAKHGDNNQQIVQTVVGGRQYCVSSSSDGYAGGSGITYTYTTPATTGTGSEAASFTLLYVDCGVYKDSTSGGGTVYNQCKTNQSTFMNNLNVLIDSLIAR